MTSQPLSEKTSDLINRKTKIFVVSDVHLKKMASPHGEAFLRLLKKAQTEAGLFIILGDLFDLWLGDGEYFVKEYGPLISEIRELLKSCRVIYFEGNHDIHLQKFWQDQLGVEVFTSGELIQFNETKIWAEHGDEINRKDRDYLLLRWFLRTKPLEKLVYSLPSGISAWIGRKASGLSRTYTQKLNHDSLMLFRSYAQSLAKTKEFDFCLLGHTHVFDDYSFDSAQRQLVNLGTWLDKPSYLQIESTDRKAEVVFVL